MPKYRAVIVGAGRMARTIDDEVVDDDACWNPYSHAAGYAAVPEVELVACADPITEKAENLQARYGVPLWAGHTRQDVVEKVWAAPIAFGMKGVKFVPYWKQQEFTVSDPEVRVSCRSKAGRRLVVLSSFTAKDRPVQLTARAAHAVVQGAWRAEGAAVNGATASVTVPAYNGLLLTVEGLAN